MLYVVETFLKMSIKPLQQHRITSRQSPLSAKHVVPIIQLDVAQAAEHKSSNGSLDPGKKKKKNFEPASQFTGRATTVPWQSYISTKNGNLESRFIPFLDLYFWFILISNGCNWHQNNA